MDKETFIEQFNKADSSINKEWLLDTLNRSVDSNLSDGNPRGHRNLIIAMEELSELSKEISKELRGKGDKTNILEELADVQIGLYYVQEICKINDGDLHKAINVKMKRLENILKANGKYR